MRMTMCKNHFSVDSKDFLVLNFDLLFRIKYTSSAVRPAVRTTRSCTALWRSASTVRRRRLSMRPSSSQAWRDLSAVRVRPILLDAVHWFSLMVVGVHCSTIKTFSHQTKLILNSEIFKLLKYTYGTFAMCWRWNLSRTSIFWPLGRWLRGACGLDKVGEHPDNMPVHHKNTHTLQIVVGK